MIGSTFRVPAILAAAIAVGLVVALAGDGWYDAPCWIGLTLPLAAVGWAARRAS